MKEYQFIRVEREDHIAVVTMSHPPVNVLSFEMLEEMSEAFSALEQDRDVWTVVLRSDQKLFAAGVDIKNLKTCDRQGNYETSERIQKVFLQIENFPHPVICAVHGTCMGGGLELALSCDLRVFDGGTRIAFTETGLGICTGAGGSQRLTKLVGKGIAGRLIYTGEIIGSAEAYRLGICEYLAEDSCFEKAMEVARIICTKGPLGVSAGKRCIDFACFHSLEEGLKYENEQVSDLFETADEKEGIAAFFEKRKPEFKNR